MLDRDEREGARGGMVWSTCDAGCCGGLCECVAVSVEHEDELRGGWPSQRAGGFEPGAIGTRRCGAAANKSSNALAVPHTACWRAV